MLADNVLSTTQTILATKAQEEYEKELEEAAEE